MSQINKYISFDKSLHDTWYYINKFSPTCFTSYNNLLDILDSTWLSIGYQSTVEELTFKGYATNALKLYYAIPLDLGDDVVLLNKFLPLPPLSKSRYVKIDKLHFLSNDTIELIDYKSGSYIPPINKASYVHTIYPILSAVHKQISIYPDIISFYYLRHGIKISAFLNLDILSNINNITEKEKLLTFNNTNIISHYIIKNSQTILSN